MAKPFQFNTKRRRRGITSRLRDGKPSAVQAVVKPEEPMQLIQGKMPDSVEEYYFALALERLDYDYSFQLPLEAGRL